MVVVHPTPTNDDNLVSFVSATSLCVLRFMKVQQITLDDTKKSPKGTKRPRSTPSPRETLETIYKLLGGQSWGRSDGWLTESPITEWCGVTCNREGQITVLELSQNNLTGRLDHPTLLDILPPTIEQLWLSENKLTGNLPAVLVNRQRFPSLTILDVGQNRLRGALHPDIARATHLSWFDTSGNELSSYFRYTSTASGNRGDGGDVATETVTKTSNHRTPLPNIHVIDSLLSPKTCQEIVDCANQFASNQVATGASSSSTSKGWQTSRHKEYPTTDLDVAVVGGRLLQVCDQEVWKQILIPSLSHLFGFELEELALEDLFVAKYSADAQRSLPSHRDGSELSFVVTLNDGFVGGGTRFLPSKNPPPGASNTTLVSPTSVGTAVLFCGRQWHEGVEITKGTRYILAGFVRVYPKTNENQAHLKSILDHAQQTLKE